MMPPEPKIVVNGHELNEAQAMAVRVALTDFHANMLNPAMTKELGPIGHAYAARAEEVLGWMLNKMQR